MREVSGLLTVFLLVGLLSDVVFAKRFGGGLRGGHGYGGGSYGGFRSYGYRKYNYDLYGGYKYKYNSSSMKYGGFAKGRYMIYGYGGQDNSSINSYGSYEYGSSLSIVYGSSKSQPYTIRHRKQGDKSNSYIILDRKTQTEDSAFSASSPKIFIVYHQREGYFSIDECKTEDKEGNRARNEEHIRDRCKTATEDKTENQIDSGPKVIVLP